MISLSTSLKGRANLQNMLTEAPQRFLITMRGWLAAERNRYVGNNQGKDGTFRKQIMRLKRSEGATDAFRRGGKWPENVAKSFKGYILNKDNLDDLTLRMGAGLRNASKFMQGMAIMDAKKGGGNVSDSKFMTLPVYRNLKKLGVENNFQNIFRDFPKDSLVPMLAKSGTLLWFDKNQMYKRQRAGKNPFKRSALLFIGKKQVKLKQHFDFSKQFYGQADSIRRRGMTALNRAVRALNEGYVGTGANISAKGSSGRTVVVNE